MNREIDMEGFGTRMKKARLDMGMTQQELANKVREINPLFGGSQSTIQAIEGGKSKKPTLTYDIATALNVTVEYLRYGNDKRENITESKKQNIQNTALNENSEIARLKKENEILSQIVENLFALLFLKKAEEIHE